ncbi:hypothetical protein CEXT_748331 [Caerostris extrusa]|uniref:Uncharacterized protein n=1 Tax=Caerostris extrusa TaxID=172846 RepID=A0AAV4X728_CAEEX|nr:hypothetical protein CEXT_748331 [Caerostris extrusa]
MRNLRAGRSNFNVLAACVAVYNFRKKVLPNLRRLDLVLDNVNSYEIVEKGMLWYKEQHGQTTIPASVMGYHHGVQLWDIARIAYGVDMPKNT